MNNYQLSKIKIKSVFISIILLFIFLFPFFCVKADIGDSCREDYECNTPEEVCNITDEQRDEGFSGNCIARPGPESGFCDEDSDCGVGEVCQENRCISGSRDDIGTATQGESCVNDSDCESGLTCTNRECAVTPRGTGSGTAVFNNPLSSDTIPELIATVLRAVLGLIGILAVGSFVYGGILYMTAAGNEDQASKAKKVLGYSVMGLVVSLLSYVIVNTVIRIIGG